MTDKYEEAEPEVLEGEFIEAEQTTAQKRMQHAREQKAVAPKLTKKEQRVNVTKILRDLGHCPITGLAKLGMNKWQELGLTKPVSGQVQLAANTALTNMLVPAYKPIDFVSPDDVLKDIPIFTGKRALPGQVPLSLEQDDEEEV